MSIGQLAKLTGVSTDTIRYYERMDLLTKATRGANGYRQYAETAIGRIQLIRNSLRFGFSLKDIRKFLDVRKSGGAPCKEVRAAATRVLQNVENQILELTSLRNAMMQTLENWDQKLANTPSGQPAHLLEGLQNIGVRAARVHRLTGIREIIHDS